MNDQKVLIQEWCTPKKYIIVQILVVKFFPTIDTRVGPPHYFLQNKMKIYIWIRKEDAISGKITEHHYQCPQPGWQNYVQVSISVDEFTRLEDKEG